MSRAAWSSILRKIISVQISISYAPISLRLSRAVRYEYLILITWYGYWRRIAPGWVLVNTAGSKGLKVCCCVDIVARSGILMAGPPFTGTK
jgi:hypothetical protein